MERLDEPTEALVRLAAAIAAGDEGLIAQRAQVALAAAVPAIWVDELLLQSILMVGYPRALVAGHCWRQTVGRPAEWLEDGTDYSQLAVWEQRGNATCGVVYGSNFEKLRDNVAALHPAMAAWMVREGYGRTLSRPGLDLGRRELCVIAQTTALRASRQLHSHLRGALHAGVSPEVIRSALAAITPEVGPDGVAFAQALWGRVKG
ncbi:MAG: hypothetical protein FJ206_04285 [Gemmatimonadetes bacterium]|nr:hypothetical protein [Gemmatimonadota bacterium]